MKRVSCIIVTLFAFVCSHTTVAQTALSSYFLDGMLYNNKINPAMKAERGYFSLLIGNTSLKKKGNVGISDFLYPRGDNELTTFMSGSVNADEFLSKLPEKAKLGVNFDERIADGYYMAKALQLLQSGHRLLGIIYILCSVVVCIIMTYIGILIADKYIK